MPTRIRHADPGASRGSGRRWPPPARSPSALPGGAVTKPRKSAPSPAAWQENSKTRPQPVGGAKVAKGRTSGHSPPPEPRNRVTSKSAFLPFRPGSDCERRRESAKYAKVGEYRRRATKQRKSPAPAPAPAAARWPVVCSPPAGQRWQNGKTRKCLARPPLKPSSGASGASPRPRGESRENASPPAVGSRNNKTTNIAALALAADPPATGRSAVFGATWSRQWLNSNGRWEVSTPGGKDQASGRSERQGLGDLLAPQLKMTYYLSATRAQPPPGGPPRPSTRWTAPSLCTRCTTRCYPERNAPVHPRVPPGGRGDAADDPVQQLLQVARTRSRGGVAPVSRVSHLCGQYS